MLSVLKILLMQIDHLQTPVHHSLQRFTFLIGNTTYNVNQYVNSVGFQARVFWNEVLLSSLPWRHHGESLNPTVDRKRLMDDS